MWIIRNNGKKLLNLERFQEVFLTGRCIQFWCGEIVENLEFESEKEAQQNFNYIIEGFKNKNSVIFI